MTSTQPLTRADRRAPRCQCQRHRVNLEAARPDRKSALCARASRSRLAADHRVAAWDGARLVLEEQRTPRKSVAVASSSRDGLALAGLVAGERHPRPPPRAACRSSGGGTRPARTPAGHQASVRLDAAERIAGSDHSLLSKNPKGIERRAAAERVIAAARCPSGAEGHDGHLLPPRRSRPPPNATLRTDRERQADRTERPALSPWLSIAWPMIETLVKQAFEPDRSRGAMGLGRPAAPSSSTSPAACRRRCVRELDLVRIDARLRVDALRERDAKSPPRSTSVVTKTRRRGGSTCRRLPSPRRRWLLLRRLLLHVGAFSSWSRMVVLVLA